MDRSKFTDQRRQPVGVVSVEVSGKEAVVAVCADGSAWRITHAPDAEWVEIDPIPGSYRDTTKP